MRWEHHFAMASAGSFVLYRINAPANDPTWCVMSLETDEPVRWIFDRQSAFSWLVNEAHLSKSKAHHIMWGADEWQRSKLVQSSASRPPAPGHKAGDAAVGQSPPS
jgi:hypothetical protein